MEATYNKNGNDMRNSVCRYHHEFDGVKYNIMVDKDYIEDKFDYIYIYIRRDSDNILTRISLDENLNLVSFKKEIGD